jgi:cytochrome c-type biogenesis protein CcmH/NrfG
MTYKQKNGKKTTINIRPLLKLIVAVFFLSILSVLGCATSDQVVDKDKTAAFEHGRKMVAEGRSQTEWMKRADALEQMKDWQGLLDWCLKWTKSEPKNAVAWGYLGNTYDNLKRYNDAIEAYRQSIRINPEDAEAWYMLGCVYLFSGNRAAALEVVQKLRRLDPEKADRLFDMVVPR